MFYRIIYRARLFQHTVQKFKAFGLIVQVSRHILFTHTAQAALALVCQGKVEQFGIFCQTDMPQRIQCTGVQVGGAVLFGGAVGAQQTTRYRIQVKSQPSYRAHTSQASTPGMYPAWVIVRIS